MLIDRIEVFDGDTGGGLLEVKEIGFWYINLKNLKF